MKVILLKDVPKIGKKYDIKEISDGYALNFLIPKKLAKLATASGIEELSLLKEKEEKTKKEKEETLLEDIKQLIDSTVKISAKANKEGHLFAGIRKEDIVLIIKDQKALDIAPERILLEKPIKEIGNHIIEVKVNGENAKFGLEITASKESKESNE
ncbi:50S ribosomal protein L9 [Patescibacteria group bacterium]|nr:50S ribosomal protein L9 [Patescibacteria group bacterium]MCG2694638.1 50S ribosomal protein L9 [Candidatus Parcubacteria bacterium]